MENPSLATGNERNGKGSYRSEATSREHRAPRLAPQAEKARLEARKRVEAEMATAEAQEKEDARRERKKNQVRWWGPVLIVLLIFWIWGSLQSPPRNDPLIPATQSKGFAEEKIYINSF